MRRTRVDGQVERQLLVALVTSREFLAQASQVLASEADVMRDAPLFHLVASWCLTFFSEYGQAPKRRIETIYYGWAQSNEDEELGDSVEDLLAELSEQFEQGGELNVPFLLDELSKFLNKRKLRGLNDALELALSRGDEACAMDAVATYRSVELAQSVGISLNDDSAWEAAFSESADPLFVFPKAAGRFLNAALVRDGLIGIQASDKKGKSYWCLEFMFRALRARRKVAFFQVGDLSQNQVLRRMGVRLSGRPLLREDCREIKVPIKVERDQDEDLGFRVAYEEKSAKSPVDAASAKEARDTFWQACGISKARDYFRLSVHANSTINVRGISAVLSRWQVERGFVPDLVLIDYADILAPEEKRKDSREEVNDTWKALRTLSQEKHVLVIVPTQANADAYDRHTQTMKNFSEDKRKYAHVTGMFALNQTPEEKEAQVMRLNWIVLRESSFNIKRCLYVGTCLALGRVMTAAAL